MMIFQGALAFLVIVCYNFLVTNRQKEYLKLIVDMFIESGEPVASSQLIKKYKIRISSATVRHEMNLLEKEGFLSKIHNSSGRVPSTKAYSYYAKNLATNKESVLFQNALKDVFAKRRISIDLTLDKAAKTISDLAGLTLVTSSSENDELLKSINLVPLNEEKATIVLVTSTGRVESKMMEFQKNIIEINDVRIAIRLFKERLVDTPLRDLVLKVEVLAPLLSQKVKHYEEIIQAFVEKVFDFHNRISSKVYGNNELIKSKDIKREDLIQLFNLIKSRSIWDSIEGELDEEQNIKIAIRPNNTSIISKKIDVANGIFKEISVVGSNRINYGNAKQALLLLEKLLKGQAKK